MNLDEEFVMKQRNCFFFLNKIWHSFAWSVFLFVFVFSVIQHSCFLILNLN